MIFSCLCPPFIIIMIIKCNRIHDHSQGNMLRLHTVHLESNGRLRTQTQRRHHLRVRQRENAWRVFARLSRPSYSLIMTTLNSCLLGLHLIPPPPFFSCVRRFFLQQTKTHEWMCCVTFFPWCWSSYSSWFEKESSVCILIQSPSSSFLHLHMREWVSILFFFASVYPYPDDARRRDA